MIMRHFLVREYPDPFDRKLIDSWGVHFFLIISEICCGTLIFAYSFLLFKLWNKTRYPFILTLTMLLLASNIAGSITSLLLHKIAELLSVPTEKINFVTLEIFSILHETFVLICIICLNLAMWLFSFRYWNIAYVMPVLLSGQRVSSCFRLTTISIFTAGVILNILFPAIYYIYSIQLYATFGESTTDI